jgi:hypothetical protein
MTTRREAAVLDEYMVCPLMALLLYSIIEVDGDDCIQITSSKL